ncbi:DJ-1/PfpI family protein [Paenibacillus turpanensis]|uniref:DJ-1/PfpI family protein n=1 Tax=Paenibacillus turpanensis TaxID=2689078 RepID=UPI00140D45D3|nr:DJ-1/PfpI family protein [Paenibacillus turpanensis]
MKIAFIFFNDMTTLDFSGFHNAVTWLKRLGYMEQLSWDYCAMAPEVTDDRGMRIGIDRVQPDLSAYDLVFMPGGAATRKLVHDEEFIRWLQTAETVRYKASVCTGALLYGAAGFLAGKQITTNPLAYAELEPYCASVLRQRVVQDGELYTGGGIAASLDLGLYFVESIAGPEAAREVQRYMDYPHYDRESVLGSRIDPNRSF